MFPAEETDATIGANPEKQPAPRRRFRYPMTESTPPLNEQEQIAIVAYRIYEDEGRPEGKAEEHWARAEHVVHEQRPVAPTREGPSLDALTPPAEMVP